MQVTVEPLINVNKKSIIISLIILERDSGQRNMSMWERSGCSNTSISSMLQNSIYQVASSRKFLEY